MIWIIIVVAFALFELVSYFCVFKLLAVFFLKSNSEIESQTEISDLAKGVIERIVLSCALANGIPQILIFFGTMKLGTRLRNKLSDDGYNDFYLMGNLYSVFLSILYSKYLLPDSAFVAELVNLFASVLDRSLVTGLS